MNPFGPAMAAVIAATRLFVHRLQPPPATHAVNTFDWSSDVRRSDGYTQLPELGELWVVGTGSVGSAVLYFLALATNRFTAHLFDPDRVRDHNITRSPIFVESDVGEYKVAVTNAFLRDCGVQNAPHSFALHESPMWAERPPGSPDILVPTANEYNVRDLIEASLPPIQIYGTTGRNWQASVIRHIPLLDPCSLCLFPSGAFAPSECATDSSQEQETKGTDASLPFLSFAAGLMAAIELVKLSVEKCPSPRNRVLYFTQPEPRFVCADLARRNACACAAPNAAAQRAMVNHSRYTHLIP
jgi:molybdopterin/thiamine biosynthesis adenylyltransferase